MRSEPESGDGFRPILEKLNVSLKKGLKRIVNGCDMALGSLRRRINAEKERVKFTQVVEELLEGALQLNVMLNTHLVRAIKDGQPKTATALYSYEPAVAGDLEFKAGESITILETTGRCWWHGCIGVEGREGYREGQFPINYCLVVAEATRQLSLGRATLGEIADQARQADQGRAAAPEAAKAAPLAPPQQQGEASAVVLREMPKPRNPELRFTIADGEYPVIPQAAARGPSKLVGEAEREKTVAEAVLVSFGDDQDDEPGPQPAAPAPARAPPQPPQPASSSTAAAPDFSTVEEALADLPKPPKQPPPPRKSITNPFADDAPAQDTLPPPPPPPPAPPAPEPVTTHFDVVFDSALPPPPI